MPLNHKINPNQSDVNPEILRIVEELKLGSGFGTVEILIHEGRVTQIEKREKFRFTQDNTKPSFKTPI